MADLFEKQYANSKVYNAFSVEEVYARAWGQLNKLADDWEPTIRGIYDIQVVLYFMLLCDAWRNRSQVCMISFIMVRTISL
ncbi:hypothetical protein QFZ77_001802 [Paenibacillus sp. V4I3]|nr:hypothetical protein [Paenibacillus sp. V4I3]